MLSVTIHDAPFWLPRHSLGHATRFGLMCQGGCDIGRGIGAPDRSPAGFRSRWGLASLGIFQDSCYLTQTVRTYNDRCRAHPPAAMPVAVG